MNTVFVNAEDLMWEQNFGEAAKRYALGLQQAGLSPMDSFYAYNQAAFCYLTLYDTSRAAVPILAARQILSQTVPVDAAHLADYYYNLSRWHWLKEQQNQAREFAHLAGGIYQQEYPANPLKIIRLQTQLGLIHFEDGSITDSAAYFALLAGDVLQEHPELAPYSWEYDYLQAGLGWLNRTHQASAKYCRLALGKLDRLPDEHLIAKAKCWDLLGNMLKKQADGLDSSIPENITKAKALYLEADTLCFAQAIKLATAANSTLVQKFNNSRIINAQRFADSTLFFRYLANLKVLLQNQPDQYGYVDRLLGYYHYFKGDLQQSIRYYEAFLRRNETDTSVDYDLLDEAYYFLREANRQLHRYKEALRYTKRGLRLFGCCAETVDLLNPQVFSRLDSLHNPCVNKYGFLAGLLLDKFVKAGRLEDLLVANRYYRLVERNYYPSLDRIEEEALLGAQLEKGRYFFSRAVEAAYRMWQISGEDQWTADAWRYAEKMKAYLLFRDMVKPQDQEGVEKSLADSIRLYQSRLDRINATLPADNRQLERWKQYDEQLRSLLDRRREREQSLWQQHVKKNGESLSTVRNALKPDQGVLQYMLEGSQAFGIYLDRDTMAFFPIEPRRKLDTLLKNYQNILAADRITTSIRKQYLNTGYLLFRYLLEPVATRLALVNELLIIPDGELQRIPFGTLLTEPATVEAEFPSLPYLIRKVQLTYCPSWQVYRSKQKTARSRVARLAYWTNEEIRSIREMSDLEAVVKQQLSIPIQFFSGSMTMKNEFLHRAADFSHLHLSLHARCNPADRNGHQLYFGKFEDTTQILYNYELGDLQLRTDLVVLAACETADGQSTVGEGTFSLARSLLQVGARRVVATLGKVPASATASLLRHFYWYLGQGEVPERALHRAKLEHLRRSNDSVMLYPGFWGRVVIIS